VSEEYQAEGLRELHNAFFFCRDIIEIGIGINIGIDFTHVDSDNGAEN
jgi:hypothetical protein